MEHFVPFIRRSFKVLSSNCILIAKWFHSKIILSVSSTSRNVSHFLSSNKKLKNSGFSSGYPEPGKTPARCPSLTYTKVSVYRSLYICFSLILKSYVRISSEYLESFTYVHYDLMTPTYSYNFPSLQLFTTLHKKACYLIKLLFSTKKG